MQCIVYKLSGSTKKNKKYPALLSWVRRKKDYDILYLREILILKTSFSVNLNNIQMALASSNVPIPCLYAPDTLPGSFQSLVQKKKERNPEFIVNKDSKLP